MLPLALYSFEHGSPQARMLAEGLDVSCIPIDVHVFPDGESRVRVDPPAQSALLYCPLDHPNIRLVELGLAAAALRQSGAQRLVLIAPYLCYMRQDKAFHAGEAVAQSAVAEWLSCLFDRIVTVDAHLHRTASLPSIFPGRQVENLGAAPLIAQFIGERNLGADVLIAGPDSESRQWVAQIAGKLGCSFLVGEKERLGDRQVQVTFQTSLLAGRPIVIVDDIVSSGQTLIAAIGALKEQGAGDIYLALTHALFSAEMAQALLQAGACGIWSTDSIPHPSNSISLAPLLAAALQSERQ